MKQPPPNTEVDTLQCIGCTYMADISDSAPPTFNRSELIRVYDIPAVDDEMDEPLMGEFEWDDEWEVDA
jgi:hypothetical protein